MILGSGRPKTGRPELGSHREGRNRKLCIRISDDDLQRLNYICETFGITKSDYIIGAIRNGVDMIDGNSIR